jgi:hypothetical protein
MRRIFRPNPAQTLGSGSIGKGAPGAASGVDELSHAKL